MKRDEARDVHQYNFDGAKWCNTSFLLTVHALKKNIAVNALLQLFVFKLYFMIRILVYECIHFNLGMPHNEHYSNHWKNVV